MGNNFIKYKSTAVNSKSDGYYPSLTVVGKAVPGLKNAKLSDDIKLVVQGRIKSAMSSSDGTQYELEVRDVSLYNKAK